MPGSAPTAPSWVTPGAPVLVIRGYRAPTITETTINKVHKRYFTVDLRWANDLRFPLDTQTHRTAGTWSCETRVILLDSDEARTMLETQRRRDLVNTALEACDQWRRNRSQDNRVAAIVALQSVEDGDQ